jgi:hypothetical protein
MGYLPLDELGAAIFFQRSALVTSAVASFWHSNKSYGDWGSIFDDAISATAILDRLLHHSTTINIRGESYRLNIAVNVVCSGERKRRVERRPLPSPDMLRNGPRAKGFTPSAQKLRALARSGPFHRT